MDLLGRISFADIAAGLQTGRLFPYGPNSILRPPARGDVATSTAPQEPRDEPRRQHGSLTLRIDAGDIQEVISRAERQVLDALAGQMTVGVDLAGQPDRMAVHATRPAKPKTTERVRYPWAHLLPAKIDGYSYVLLTSERQMIEQGKLLGNCLASEVVWRHDYWRRVVSGQLLMADFQTSGGTWAGTADIGLRNVSFFIEGRNKGQPPRKLIRAAFELGMEIHRALGQWTGPRVIVERVPLRREPGGDGKTGR